MNNNFNGGVWPVMLTPFTENNEVDYYGLESLVNWYINQGVSGLFAVCQSSEMLYLTQDEMEKIAKFIVKIADGRVPVIASGHTKDNLDEQVKQINAMSNCGVDAVILITSRIAREEESDEVWLENLQSIVSRVNPDIPLGFYECPLPYKRLISKKALEWCRESGRFYFLKDTSCDMENLAMKAKVLSNTKFKIYNANTSTLLESLKIGCAGYSGVMANFHAKEYVWLCNNINKKEAIHVSDVLSLSALIERQYYPVNAKYHLSEIEGVEMGLTTRVKDMGGLSPLFKEEVHKMDRVIKKLRIYEEKK